MLKSYLLSIDGLVVRRSQVLDYLDKSPQILNWFAIMKDSILITSKNNATQLREMLHLAFPFGWFIITELQTGNYDGWLPKENWDFIANPRSSGRWS
ncbi:MAG: hypothetical protein ABSG99_03500 [Sedimentisphaerales bacterium]